MKKQEYINKIYDWTQENKMVLNQKKSNAMIFNFCKDFKFTTRIQISNQTMDIVNEAKLLGVMLNDKLTWDDNTAYLVQRPRMRLLHKCAKRGSSQYIYSGTVLPGLA